MVSKKAARRAPRARRASAEPDEGTGSAADFLPSRLSLSALRSAAAHCRGCDLWRCGTQTVFGEGPRSARVCVVGEQPGDVEDREGKPFVGPSGRLLDIALERAHIDRATVYVTNAVKHFKWEKRTASERRIHKTPNAREVRACHPWLDAELAVVKPALVICLGATAAQSMLGKSFRVTQHRGELLEASNNFAMFATVHPSAVLRAPHERRKEEERAFMNDIAKAGEWLTTNQK